MPVIESEHGAIDFVETGEGAPVLCIHGSFSNAAAWRPLQGLLRPACRVIAPNLFGCGRTAAWPSDAPPSIERQSDLIHAVIEHLGEPVHLVGHSHGGIVALETALGRPGEVRSLTLLDALPANVLGTGTACAALERFHDDYLRAFEGGDRLAGARVIDFWTGEGTFAALPERFREFIVESTALNLMDWRANWAYAPDPAAMRSLSIPALLLCGAAGNPIACEISRSLAEMMPDARLVELPEASHMMISTHAGAVAESIVANIGRSRFPA